MVAVDKGTEAIIDDGLLIYRGRIVAGRSAKREATRTAAVRRAIFDDPEHRSQVAQAVASLNADSVLVLGTSRHMVERILTALGLEDIPIEWVPIETVASPDERRLAQYIRQSEGKHVIPAPTMEVQKSFSGYLVDPLRFIFRRKGRQVEVEKSIVRPTYSSMGRFYIADTVLSAIVVHAGHRVPGIARVSRVMVQSSQDGILIQVDVTPAVTRNLFSLLRQVQAEIRQDIEMMTSINVLGVRVETRRILIGPS
ncbi:hypothetical protein HIJ39_07195 [Sulfobacillus sp. DSM 109850]|uniref:Asp23/Gls24 family envelope stress response protein n=2 Tax=Sulfobacillus harzensis TaxID=2729629 RepID=A0A7Y0L2S4_9FIRM|nr:hypothetical protein [Sulfobacillus harzensis]